MVPAFLFMSSRLSGFQIEYFSDPVFPQHSEQTIVRILYGARTEASESGLELGLPPLGVPALCEHWTSNCIERRGESLGFRFVCFGSRMFAYAVFKEDSPDLEALTQQVYRDLLRLAREQGYPWILRVWNYFPDIVGPAGNLNRYQSFCEGRRRALMEDKQGAGQSLPAVTTSGSFAPGFAVYFLLGKEPGQSLENPRQTAPSDYPEHLGPHGPSFCRGVSHAADGQVALYLSGTASITGHETQHHGDAAAQAREVLHNHAAVIEQARIEGASRPERLHDLPFEKIYLANPENLSQVQDEVRAIIGPDTPCYFLHSCLCRNDLLLEMESTIFDEPA